MNNDKTIILENESLKIEFDANTGALVKVYVPGTEWEAIGDKNLGLSFQMMVPLPKRRNNNVFGNDQVSPKVTVASDKSSVQFVWDTVTSQYGGKHDITVFANVTLEKNNVVFEMTIDNKSEYTVENVLYPYIGGLTPPPNSEWFKTFIYKYAAADEWSIWPQFDNHRGYFGTDYPFQVAQWSAGTGAPMSPYILLRNKNQGLYIGVNTPSSELVAWNLELRPGYGSSIDHSVPKEKTIADKDVDTRFAAVHVPYIQSGEKRTLTQINIEQFTGSWEQGVDIYKEWRRNWSKPPVIPEWAKEPHSWQQIHINSPEDELRMQFKELIKVGKQCAKHGVKAIQLVGWNDGGQDQGNPLHDPDPRLGTFVELKQAIKDIQKLGVKVILFAKFTWADRATDWFRNELVKYSVKDPYGDYYHYQGYMYQTPTQLLDINTKRLIPMCFLSKRYLEICNKEFNKTVELGADGILFDECLHHTPTLLCFDTDHGHRYGAPTYANDNELIYGFSKITEKNHPEFLYAGEACYDWEFESYHLSYHRSEDVNHIPLSRYMRPEVPLMTAVTGFNDRNMINQCLLYRYIISYEPYNFKGMLDDYPLTMDYGKKMDALRTKHRNYFWDGEFTNKVGANVTRKGCEYHPYAVYKNRKDDSYGVVIANYDNKKTITVKATLDNGKRLKKYRLVDDQTWHDKDEIIIPPESAVIVLEQE